MARNISTTEQQPQTLNAKEFSEIIGKLQAQLSQRNEHTPEAISEDIQHIRNAITTIWNNADLPMSVRARWKAILSLISPIAKDVEKLARLMKALEGNCYIIDKDGKFREATCEEIISALDNTPNK